MQKDFNNRPAEALLFRQPEICNFDVQTQDGKHTVRLTAFSGKEFHHWWWGRCVFDRAGAIIPFPKIPIDFNHDPKEALGYLEQFSGSPELIGSCFLVPFKEDDRASEIIYKKQAGVPYQCSVALGDNVFEYEYVKPEKETQVNGQTVYGNEDGIIIFRRFEVIGVAICLYGSDSNTSVFNKQEQTFNNSGENKMASNNETKGSAADAGRQQYKRFTSKFGNERGGRYFADGLSEDEANGKYIEEVSQDVSDKDAKIAELEAGLSGSGEKQAVSSEEFRKLQEENKRFKAAAGLAGGEALPVSSGQSAKPKAKEFSPLPENLRAYNAKVKEHLNR